MKDNGQMINSMGMGLRFGLMAVDMKGIMIWEKKVVEESMCGKMAATLMEIGQIIGSLAKENMFGRMEEDTKETG